MAELLHYLDKMEYRPTPKSRGKVLLKRRPESSAVTTSEEELLLLDIVDKRPVAGFKRVIVKEYERVIGVVQEKKKRREGEPVRGPGEIYVETSQEMIEEMELPLATQKPIEEMIETVPSVSASISEEEPKTPEELSRELDKRMAEVEEEEREQRKEGLEEETEKEQEETEKEQEETEKEQEEELVPVVPGKQKKPKGPVKKRGKQPEIQLPTIQIDANTKIDGEPVLVRIPERPKLDKLVVRAPSYYMSNRKLYLQNIAKLFSKFSKELLDDKTPVSCDNRGSTTKDIDLLIHQRIVREYLNIYTPYRGLLLYHGLGSGKTCTSIAIAEAAKTHKRIFIMTPASLKMNFFSELKKCGDSLYKKNQYWEFISTEGRPEYVAILSQILSIPSESIMKNSGAWLSDIRKTEPNYSDLSPEHQKSLDEQLNEMIRSKYVDINYNGLTEKKFEKLLEVYGKKHTTGNPFDHSVVLVDEAHNLVSRIVNNLGKEKSISAKLYNLLQSATDAKIVFMSGTPIINYPHEMGVLFNMLRGHIKTWQFTIPTTKTKLTSEKILKMFHDANFKTFDYVDYSNDTLSITRNPFGFVNVSATISTAAAPNIPKTRVTGGKKSVKEYESDTDSETHSDTEKPTTHHSPKEKNERPKKQAKTKKQPHKSSSRKTAKKHNAMKETIRDLISREEDEDSDGEIEISAAKYKMNKGAIELPKDKPTDLSDEVKAQIALEIHQERNAVGEDHYHSGGAAVIDNRYAGVRLDEQGNLSDLDFVKTVKKILTDNDVKFLSEVKLEKYKSLPDTKKEFTEIFINMDTLQVQRPDVLKKRILGLTSYFRSAQESLLPSFVLSTDPKAMNPQFHIEYVEMSDHQFVDYAKERASEISREPKHSSSGADANKEMFKVSASYRTFTRAKCNFSFPAEIPRPMPPTFDPKQNIAANIFDNTNDDNELDDNNEDGDINNTTQPISREYDRAIVKALADLKEGGDQYLTPEGLKMCSPKFAKILANLKDPENLGLHLVYSAFRTLEGVGVLKLILEANGFAEFKLKKMDDVWTIVESENPADKAKPKFVLYTGTETAEEKEIIRNVYNSNWEFVPATIVEKLREINANNYYGEIIKIIMITSSGAEGINLENTRFVHIVEPYWHMVRIDQVVGRARRICSHKNLPEKLRTIKVFLYMSKFSDKQKFSGENVGIMNRDTSRLMKVAPGAKMGETAITTDESLFEIAVLKDRLTKQLLKSVKESSVDCEVYDNTKEGLVCYTYGRATSNEFGAFPSYAEDRYVREGTDVEKRTVAIEKVVIKGKNYAHNTETDELYDYAVYKKSGKPVPVGRMGIMNGKPVVLE
jgi:flagellar biosynthesis GTPase FlhF